MTTPALLADEGMWVFNNLPLKQLEAAHAFVPPEGWAEHLQKAAVRFNTGGSGSFVSADGLIMTNHHVGADTIAKLSTAEHDYLNDGFHARSFDEELKAQDLELNVLAGIEDVTDQVNADVKPEMSDAETALARRKAMARIEQESLEKTGLRSNVITLYQGGQYHLYTYKKYTDVRLVFAPEFPIAFFGGDEDNFEYPRYDLDVSFFRAYEDGKPANVENFLKWSENGSEAGDLVFVVGNPGRTNRLNTLASLIYQRDESVPRALEMLRGREQMLQEYSKQGEEQARQAQDYLFGIQNSRKALIGKLGGLQDLSFMTRKEAGEQELRARIAADAQKQKTYGQAWDRIADAQKTAAEIGWRYSFLEGSYAFDSDLFGYARSLVRLAEESAKPNAERLREYGEAGLESLRFQLFSSVPVYPELEIAKLTQSLSYWQRKSPDDPMVARVLQGRSPEQAAKDLVSGSKLTDPEVRKKLAEGGKEAILASDDPLIKLALVVDEDARELRKRREDEVEGIESAQYALIAKALFEEKGDSTYPDATFTLRLAYGTVKGYEVDGQPVPPFTTIGGAFDHERIHHAQPPYKLPESWHKSRQSGALKLDTPMNFVSTADIIGGNSGSPVVNRDKEVVGLIFDGNIQSLVLDYGYDDKIARAVSVDSRAIAEALRSVYKADRLLKELTGGK